MYAGCGFCLWVPFVSQSVLSSEAHRLGRYMGCVQQCSQNDEEKYTYIIASLKRSPIRHTDSRLAKCLRPKAFGTRYRISSTLCLATSKFVGEGTRCFSS